MGVHLSSVRDGFFWVGLGGGEGGGGKFAVDVPSLGNKCQNLDFFPEWSPIV